MEEKARGLRYRVALITGPGHLLMSQSILVTGGAGYVGSHACKVLAAAGYRPVV
jgi:NADPH:quinone reductase-like Zn-dependent oxidoreductase